MTSKLAFLGFGAAGGLIFVVGLLVILAFEIAMFINVITHKNISQTSKVLWVVGMLILHPFVAIIYYFTDYKKS